MVEILCPHCEEEIELDDDASGEFACPYCEGEFEWGMDEDDDLDAFMLQADTSPVIQTQNVVIPAGGESNTIAIVAIVFSGIAALGVLSGAWMPLLGLCNLLFAIPALLLSYMSREKIRHVENHKDTTLVKTAWVISLVSLILTILPQIFWLIYLFVFAEASDVVVVDGFFECDNGEVIPEAWVGDGEADCSDGSDEN
tara:strand:+ start:763 stop:1356 length:594 start_codon:yes stop_codon:yes gene_type:complete